MDYLPIQGTSVPCERAFSSSAETDTKKRNRLGPDLFEASQITKNWINNNVIDFTRYWFTAAEDMIDESWREGQLDRLLSGDDSVRRRLIEE